MEGCHCAIAAQRTRTHPVWAHLLLDLLFSLGLAKTWVCSSSWTLWCSVLSVHPCFHWSAFPNTEHKVSLWLHANSLKPEETWPDLEFICLQVSTLSETSTINCSLWNLNVNYSKSWSLIYCEVALCWFSFDSLRKRKGINIWNTSGVMFNDMKIGIGLGKLLMTPLHTCQD